MWPSEVEELKTCVVRSCFLPRQFLPWFLQLSDLQIDRAQPYDYFARTLHLCSILNTSDPTQKFHNDSANLRPLKARYARTAPPLRTLFAYPSDLRTDRA